LINIIERVWDALGSIRNAFGLAATVFQKYV